MINNSTAMLRKLREFFDNRIGMYAWNSVRILHTGQGEDDTYEFLQIEYLTGDRRFRIDVVAPDDAPPLGRIEMSERGGKSITGDICDQTFDQIHARLMAA